MDVTTQIAYEIMGQINIQYLDMVLANVIVKYTGIVSDNVSIFQQYPHKILTIVGFVTYNF